MSKDRLRSSIRLASLIAGKGITARAFRLTN
jgi:hypothetical protein